jgi:hypothetical protein
MGVSNEAALRKPKQEWCYANGIQMEGKARLSA